MKKVIRTMAVFGLLVLAATGCTKENAVEPAPIVSENAVYYSAGNHHGSENLFSDEEWDAFLDRMVALAREGYVVTIFSGSPSSYGSAKEVVTYTTTSEDDAKAWCKNMLSQGYAVNMSYDDRTGIYTCTATK